MDTLVPVEFRAHPEAALREGMAGAMAHQRSIKHALDWLARHDPPLAPTEMVTQDEYSHDILVLYPSPEPLWLVYGST